MRHADTRRQQAQEAAEACARVLSVERLFERIAVRLGPGLPVGLSWHTLLLRSMKSDVEGIRPAVINHELALRLVDYLRFRRLFRHTYGSELEWDKLHPLVQRLEATLTRLRQQMEQLMKTLAELEHLWKTVSHE